ncbi:hypothetical protein RFI_28357 [Reticulomyxa filosa]|uniref:Uncharacterized protein n=1 Tax=Reticulomyxa filosa TaxID=46433 RepID=X6M7L8_RETFI|nr:hypothetical protein RFI_28357 [Reticulomyxa filosa]|eukprot:ETO09030.1 hypothetical protein RFI_28357 [Reticulomyxa filosa]
MRLSLEYAHCGRVIILTDRKSVINPIFNKCDSDIYKLSIIDCQKILISFNEDNAPEIYWVKCHSGIPGNDKVNLVQSAVVIVIINHQGLSTPPWIGIGKNLGIFLKIFFPFVKGKKSPKALEIDDKDQSARSRKLGEHCLCISIANGEGLEKIATPFNELHQQENKEKDENEKKEKEKDK